MRGVEEVAEIEKTKESFTTYFLFFSPKQTLPYLKRNNPMRGAGWALL